MDTTLIFIGSGCLVCLMPLAIYCLYLSHLNGRNQPTLIAGHWDFGSLLLGLSGFIILSGPLFLTLVHSTWRGYAYGGWAQLRSVGKMEAFGGTLIACGYFVILAAVISYALRRRRPVTEIYNVQAGGMESSLTSVLDDLGYAWKRDRGVLVIATTKPTDSPTSSAPSAPASVRIEGFPATGHVTLRWAGNWQAIRPEVEPLLTRAIAPYSVDRNAFAGWMFTASISIMIVMLLWLVALIYLVVTPAPR